MRGSSSRGSSSSNFTHFPIEKIRFSRAATGSILLGVICWARSDCCSTRHPEQMGTGWVDSVVLLGPPRHHPIQKKTGVDRQPKKKALPSSNWLFITSTILPIGPTMSSQVIPIEKLNDPSAETQFRS